MFAKADEALISAKESGKACYRIYGVEEIDVKEDKRPVALLVSKNRNIISTIHALIPDSIRIIEMSNMEHMEQISLQDMEKMEVVYLDLSEHSDAASEIWKEIRESGQLRTENIMAICQEGNLPQYAEAIQNGVADLLSAPLDTAAFKRRSRILLQEKFSK